LYCSGTSTHDVTNCYSCNHHLTLHHGTYRLPGNLTKKLLLENLTKQARVISYLLLPDSFTLNRSDPGIQRIYDVHCATLPVLCGYVPLHPSPTLYRALVTRRAAQGADGRFTGRELEEESPPGLRRLTAAAEEADSGRNRGSPGRDRGAGERNCE
jgi:hypothetical protein